MSESVRRVLRLACAARAKSAKASRSLREALIGPPGYDDGTHELEPVQSALSLVALSPGTSGARRPPASLWAKDYDR